MQATLELFVERPFELVTLAAVAERAGVGMQTVIRRVGTKDGLVEAVGEWVAPQVRAALGAPLSADPAVVAAAFRRHYTQWGAVLERTQSQEDSSPALQVSAENGRTAHRRWIAAAFADFLATVPAPARGPALAELVAVTGVELWLVLTKYEGLSPDQAEDTVTTLISACLGRTRAATGHSRKDQL